MKTTFMNGFKFGLGIVCAYYLIKIAVMVLGLLLIGSPMAFIM